MVYRLSYYVPFVTLSCYIYVDCRLKLQFDTSNSVIFKVARYRYLYPYVIQLKFWIYKGEKLPF